MSGGCLLRTVFEGLGPNGRAAEDHSVRWANKGYDALCAHPGRYVFHCGENMYSGTVVAR